MSSIDNNIYSIITKPPTYIRALVDSDEEIILVYSKINNVENCEESIMPVSPEIKRKNTSILDTTGSPLKYSFDNSSIMNLSVLECQQNNWMREEEKHYPLTIEEARHFITNYFANNTSSKVVWCVCDGQDKNKTVLLSAQQLPESISRISVTNNGYFSSSNKPTNLNSSMKINGAKSTEVKKISSSLYQLYGSKIREQSADSNCATPGSVTLEVLNNSSSRSKLDGVQTIMTIQAIVGHREVLSYFLWRDLVLLELYINTFSQYSCQQMVHSDWIPTTTCIDHNIAQDLVNSAIQIVHSSYQRAKQTKKQAVELSKIVETVIERSNLDITDQLWAVLIHCSTYGRLVDCLNAFVAEIAFNHIKVYIAESNKCFMAELLRGILSGKMAVPTFTGTQPIEILIEMGIEKLRKDYVYICNLGQITDEKELTDLFKFNSEIMEEPKFRKTLLIMPKVQIINLDHVEHEMMILGQLETLLEILLLVPSNWLQYITGPAFKHFLGNDSPITSFSMLANNNLHELVVNLPINVVQQHVVGSKPTNFSYTEMSDTKWQSLKAVIHQSLQPIFPPCIYKFDPAVDATETDTDNICFHHTTLTQITYLFPKPNGNNFN